MDHIGGIIANVENGLHAPPQLALEVPARITMIFLPYPDKLIQSVSLFTERREVEVRCEVFHIVCVTLK